MADAAPETRTIDELANRCFGCGQNNPSGLRLRFVVGPDAAGEIVASSSFTLAQAYEGAPGYIHGGIIATLMDEVMSKLNRPLAVLAMTRHLAVDYLRPVPVGAALVLEGRTERREGRKLFHTATLSLADGTLLARGKGLFIAVDAGLVDLPRQPLDSTETALVRAPAADG